MPELGRIAYEAYCEKTGWKSLVTGADLPGWDLLKPEIRDAWNASAQAISDQLAPAPVATTRCKLTLGEITQVSWSPTAKRYRFNAVCSDEVPENRRFAKFTPSGTFEMLVDNPPAQERLVLGQSYYFDLTRATA